MVDYLSFFEKLETLETEQLILRDVRVEDAAAIYAYSSQPVFYQSLGRKIPASLDDTQRRIETSLTGVPWRMPRNWVVELKAESRIIGDCGFNVYRPDNRRAEVNYAIDPAYWNRGLATEAVLCVLEYGFNRLNLNRIQAICHTANASSARVIQKAGLTFEGLLRDYIWFEQGPMDMNMHSILKDEWQASSKA
jgi:ribosomal-protein-alanine N-acetyltransferase